MKSLFIRIVVHSIKGFFIGTLSQKFVVSNTNRILTVVYLNHQSSTNEQGPAVLAIINITYRSEWLTARPTKRRPCTVRTVMCAAWCQTRMEPVSYLDMRMAQSLGNRCRGLLAIQFYSTYAIRMAFNS